MVFWCNFSSFHRNLKFITIQSSPAHSPLIGYYRGIAIGCLVLVFSEVALQLYLSVVLWLMIAIFWIVPQVSPDGKQFSITSPDRRIRVFGFRTGKLRRVYDESLEVIVASSWTIRHIFASSYPHVNHISCIAFRWHKTSREVMFPYTGWMLLILGEEWP